MLDVELLVRWPGPTILCISFVSGLLLFFTFLRKNTSSASTYIGNDAEHSSYPPIEPLPNFDWKTKEPVKIRPFKPKYHMTMSMSPKSGKRYTASNGYRHPRRNCQ